MLKDIIGYGRRDEELSWVCGRELIIVVYIREPPATIWGLLTYALSLKLGLGIVYLPAVKGKRILVWISTVFECI